MAPVPIASSKSSATDWIKYGTKGPQKVAKTTEDSNYVFAHVLSTMALEKRSGDDKLALVEAMILVRSGGRRAARGMKELSERRQKLGRDRWKYAIHKVLLQNALNNEKLKSGLAELQSTKEEPDKPHGRPKLIRHPALQAPQWEPTRPHAPHAPTKDHPITTKDHPVTTKDPVKLLPVLAPPTDMFTQLGAHWGLFDSGLSHPRQPGPPYATSHAHTRQCHRSFLQRLPNHTPLSQQQMPYTKRVATRWELGNTTMLQGGGGFTPNSHAHRYPFTPRGHCVSHFAARPPHSPYGLQSSTQSSRGVTAGAMCNVRPFSHSHFHAATHPCHSAPLSRTPATHLCPCAPLRAGAAGVAWQPLRQRQQNQECGRVHETVSAAQACPRVTEDEGRSSSGGAHKEAEGEQDTARAEGTYQREHRLILRQACHAHVLSL